MCEDFQQIIWNFYTGNKRTFSWRNNKDPYAVVVSEIMLQQTQTYRVEPKYQAFLRMLPTVQALAQSDLRTVLTLWQGLGYNRRGKFLYDMAQQITCRKEAYSVTFYDYRRFSVFFERDNFRLSFLAIRCLILQPFCRHNEFEIYLCRR